MADEDFCASTTSAEGEFACTLRDSIDSLTVGVDTFFLLFSGAAVFLMQSGFAMLCAGSVRQKNVRNIMLKNLLDACGGALGFWAVGFALAYGDKDGDTSTLRFIGNAEFALTNFTEGGDYIGWFFQFAFAATAATIVAGTVAERCKMAAYLCYSVFLTGFVYPVVVHSIWASDGFLSAFAVEENLFRGQGVIDFAGSGVVHMTGGATALVAAIILGPRKGRFYDDDGNILETPGDMTGHSAALQVLGTFILWFGWYGFNPGSALAIGNEGSAAVAGLCAVTTTISAAAGCVSSMFTDSIIESLKSGEISYDLGRAMNGALGGLVGITASCSVVTPWAAVIIGVISGWVYLFFSKILVSLRIDDAVDAVPVHFACGFWGVIAVGFFSEPARQSLAYSGSVARVGFLYDTSDGTLLLIQLIATAWIIGWVCATMVPFFVILKAAGLFRVDPLEEEVGLDISHHRGAAYDMSGPKQEDLEAFVEVRASRHGKVEVPKEVSKAAAVVYDSDGEEIA